MGVYFFWTKAGWQPQFGLTKQSHVLNREMVNEGGSVLRHSRTED